MRNKKLFDCDLVVKALMPIVVPFLKRQNPEEFISQASEKEKKAVKVALEIGKIVECIDQIFFSVEMLSGFRKKKNSEINRHDYIVFMIENFYLRITSVFDRILRFTNVVFEIGLPERECRESTIISNNKIRGTEVEGVLKKIKKITNKYRSIRNQVAHSNAYKDTELSPIENFYFMISEDNSFGLEQYKNMYKVMADKYIRDKKKEFAKSAEEIEKITNEFFDSIIPYVILYLNRND